MATDIFTATGTWTPPARVGYALIECWGAGGAGAHGTSSGHACSGAGGGAYSKKLVSVNQSITYTVTVGVGGVNAGSGDYSGQAGGDSWFGSAGLVLAKGGSGGIQSTNEVDGGQGGQASAGIGDVKFSGGNGGHAGSPADSFGSSGGGGGAGDANDGGNAPSVVFPSPDNGAGGVGGTTDGGNGGVGGSPGGTAIGGDGSVRGGGGGGARTAGGSYGHGGDGARGEVRITYYTIEAAFLLNLIH